MQETCGLCGGTLDVADSGVSMHKKILAPCSCSLHLPCVQQILLDSQRDMGRQFKCPKHTDKVWPAEFAADVETAINPPSVLSLLKSVANTFDEITGDDTGLSQEDHNCFPVSAALFLMATLKSLRTHVGDDEQGTRQFKELCGCLEGIRPSQDWKEKVKEFAQNYSQQSLSEDGSLSDILQDKALWTALSPIHHLISPFRTCRKCNARTSVFTKMWQSRVVPISQPRRQRRCPQSCASCKSTDLEPVRNPRFLLYEFANPLSATPPVFDYKGAVCACLSRSTGRRGHGHFTFLYASEEGGDLDTEHDTCLPGTSTFDHSRLGLRRGPKLHLLLKKIEPNADGVNELAGAMPPTSPPTHSTQDHEVLDLVSDSDDSKEQAADNDGMPSLEEAADNDGKEEGADNNGKEEGAANDGKEEGARDGMEEGAEDWDGLSNEGMEGNDEKQDPNVRLFRSFRTHTFFPLFKLYTRTWQCMHMYTRVHMHTHTHTHTHTHRHARTHTLIIR